MRPVSKSIAANESCSPDSHSNKAFLARILLIATLALTICLVAARAQAPAAGSNWDHLKALPPGTRLHVSADHMNHTCSLMSVDDASLVCGKHSFPRAEVRSVKLARYAVSYLGGAAIGAGVGGGALAAVASSDSFFSHDKASAFALGAVIFGTVGALATGPADVFRGPTVYRRQ